MGDRPIKVTSSLFEGLLVTNARGEQKKLNDDDAQDLLFTLRMKNYVTKQGQLTQQYHDDKKQGSLDFGEYNEYRNDIEKRLDAVFNPDAVKPENARQTREAHFDKKKFSSKQFQDMWKKINQQTYYTVDFKTDELIEKAVVALDHHLVVSEIRIEVVEGTLGDEIKNKEKLQQGEAMKVSGTHTQNVRELIGSRVKYDLIGKLVENTGLTRRAIVTILQKVSPKTFLQFQSNPEEFIIKAGNIINECKAIAVIEHVKYHKLNQEFDSDIFSASALKGRLGVNAMESHKSLYDLVVVDSKGIEMDFANQLESRNEVAVYTKLPNGFYINTPVGHYNPDWAVVFHEGSDIKHIYFVAETKGYDKDSLKDYRRAESVKIECASRHFATISDSHVTYDVVKNYDELWDIITKP